MPFEIGGSRRPIAIAALFAWLLTGTARAGEPDAPVAGANPPASDAVAHPPDAKAPPDPTDASDSLANPPVAEEVFTRPPDESDSFEELVELRDAFEGLDDSLYRDRRRPSHWAHVPKFEPLRLGAFSIGKRGVVYRNTMLLGRRELPYRVWAGRSRKQLTLGLDLEPRLHRQKLRVGAYGSAYGFGVAMRLRY